jgi:hypothetical protein
MQVLAHTTLAPLCPLSFVASTPVRQTHRPVSWMMSLTIPLMYPFFSAKSKGLSLAGFFLLWVWALKIPPDLRWFLITRYVRRIGRV